MILVKNYWFVGTKMTIECERLKGEKEEVADTVIYSLIRRFAGGAGPSTPFMNDLMRKYFPGDGYGPATIVVDIQSLREVSVANYETQERSATSPKRSKESSWRS